MPATFRHYCVPKQTPMAYVQALCTNTSKYLFLGSDVVNVFFGTRSCRCQVDAWLTASRVIIVWDADNNFVATTSIPPVSPGETFRRCRVALCWTPCCPWS